MLGYSWDRVSGIFLDVYVKVLSSALFLFALQMVVVQFTAPSHYPHPPCTKVVCLAPTAALPTVWPPTAMDSQATLTPS